MGARKQHDRKIPNNHMFLLCGCVAAVVVSLLMDISETKFYKFLVVVPCLIVGFIFKNCKNSRLAQMLAITEFQLSFHFWSW